MSHSLRSLETMVELNSSDAHGFTDLPRKHELSTSHSYHPVTVTGSRGLKYALPKELEANSLSSEVDLKNEKRGFVTFLSGNGDYIKGVVALAKSLRSVGSKYTLVVGVTRDVPDEHRWQLVENNCEVRGIDWIYPSGAKNAKFAMDYYVTNYSKLRIWEFDDFSRLVYLDGDMLCLENVDELFNLPSGGLAAVKDCFCEETWSHTVQHKLGWCQQEPNESLWTSLELKPLPYFNAGMLVFEPSRVTFSDMMEKLEEWPITPFAEQDFLNQFFRDKFLPIPSKYNLVLAMLWRHPKNVHLPKVKIAHFCAKGSKPWEFDPQAEHMDLPEVKYLVDRWNKVYFSET